MRAQLFRRPVAGFVFAFVVATDQLMKSWSAAAGPSLGEVRNHGLLLGIGAAPVPALMGGTLLVMAVFLAVIGRPAVELGAPPEVLALISGGFVAHALDRARHGAVRDFIHTPWIIIDVADIAVVVGIVVLTIVLVMRLRTIRADSWHLAIDRLGFRVVVTHPGADA